MVSNKSGSVGVVHVTIDDRRSGQRLDNFLIATLKGVPRTHIYRILRRGEVRINRGRAKPDYRLRIGDIVRLPPVRMAPPRPDPGDPQRFEWLESRVLHEDDSLLVLNKPAGLAVHGGSGVPIGLIEGLRAARPTAPFLELVHRLDRDTSGCLMLAKSRAALTVLHEQLRSGMVSKEYLALVRGVWRGHARQVNLGLERSGSLSGARRVRTSQTGKRSSTCFTPKQRYSGATLLQVELTTGRTHQARVHAGAIGHPIAGDDRYGDRAFNADLRQHGLKRLFLHAERLSFSHPMTGSRIVLTTGLPDDLSEVLRSLDT